MRYKAEQSLSPLLLLGASFSWGDTVPSVGGLWEGWKMAPQVSNCSLFFSAAHKESSFDVILSGVVPGSASLHSAEVLAEMARILRPGGCLFLKEPVETTVGKDVYSEGERLAQPSLCMRTLSPEPEGPLGDEHSVVVFPQL